MPFSVVKYYISASNGIKTSVIEKVINSIAFNWSLDSKFPWIDLLNKICRVFTPVTEFDLSDHHIQI